MSHSAFLLCCLAILAIANGVQSNPLSIFTLSKGENPFFWYRTEDGQLIKAYLAGGPRLSPAATDADIKFQLRTLANPKTTEEIVIDDDGKLAASHYVAGAPLKILVHGFNSGMNSGVNKDFVDGYFGHGFNYNVISVDWSKHAAAPWYDTAAQNAKVVGNKIARLIQYLISKGVVTIDKVHIAGHSLGAHSAGIAGLTLGGKVGRITAMDPALPLFGQKPEEERIDKSDAVFVDVIHAAGGSLLEGGLAFDDPLGHVDFYPNSGAHQPGCPLDPFGACSHGRAHDYPAESIGNPNAFKACKCNSWDDYKNGVCPCTEVANMGEHVSLSARGNYYLYTNGKSPYSQT